jgi:alpha-aminoadipate/glutamate carrier protein LysW
MVLQLCPSCEGKVQFAETVRPSEIIECGDCGSVLEVVSTNPFSLALAPEVAEDWGE